MKAWNTHTIADLGKVVTGKTPPSAKPEQFGDEYPFVTPSDIQFGNKHTTTERFLSERGIEAHKRIQLPKKTVCVVCIGATIGKVCVTDQLSISNQQINSILVDAKEHDPDFVFYMASLLRRTLEAYSGGAATPIVNKGAFSKIKLQVPERPTQRTIAAILTAYDDLTETNKRRIALLEKMAEELYREWFVRMRFPGYQNTKFVKGVPKGWEVRELQECAAVNSSCLGRNDRPEVIHYVDIGSVTTNKIGDVHTLPLSEAPGRAKRRVQHGDIIWSSVRPSNRAYCLIYRPIENLIVSTGFAVIRPKAETPFTFLNFVVTSNGFVDQMTAVAKGAAYPATSFDDFEKAKLLWPGEDLLAAFHERCEPLFHQKHNLTEQNRTLSQTRDLLLPRLISGKLSVEDLDIQYSPSMQEEATEPEPAHA